ncbi:MAG: A/G-specific adenine glycosylase [Proteobacteria bacterium]|nr:A/G-specific adenine glycosylase [Pseudomonadota bacterium]
MADFAEKIVRWHNKSGRKNLPWQNKSPYHVWISEIMLQQTQVIKVIDYFNHFIERFPDLTALAQADEQQVLAMWSGLGYYNRAKNIHKTARICQQIHNTQIPETKIQLEALPGIGRSTAGAILSLAFGQTAAIMDGNVKRVFSRYFLIAGEPNSSSTLKKLWDKAEQMVPTENPATYNQALMDIGATICTRTQPSCDSCPIEKNCEALANQLIEHYPDKNKKVKKQRIDIHVVLDIQQHNIILSQREAKGIWPNLWFLPDYKSEEKLREVFKQPPKLDFTIKHTLTHRQLHIHVYLAKIKNSTAKYQRIAINDLIKYPHPKALEKILEKHKNDNS